MPIDNFYDWESEYDFSSTTSKLYTSPNWEQEIKLTRLATLNAAKIKEASDKATFLRDNEPLLYMRKILSQAYGISESDADIVMRKVLGVTTKAPEIKKEYPPSQFKVGDIVAYYRRGISDPYFIRIREIRPPSFRNGEQWQYCGQVIKERNPEQGKPNLGVTDWFPLTPEYKPRLATETEKASLLANHPYTTIFF